MVFSRREQLLAQLRNNLAIATKAAGLDIGSAKNQTEAKVSVAPAANIYDSSGIYERGVSSQSSPSSLSTLPSGQSTIAGISAGSDLLSNRCLSASQTTSLGSASLLFQTRPTASANEDLMSKVLKTIPGIEEGLFTELLKQREQAKEANAALSATQARLKMHSEAKLAVNNHDNTSSAGVLNLGNSAVSNSLSNAVSSHGASSSHGAGAMGINENITVKAPVRVLSASERAQLINAMEEMHGSISALQDALASLSDMKRSMLERPESSHRDALIQENTRMQDDLNKQLWSVNHAATEIAKKLADDATSVNTGFAADSANSSQQSYVSDGQVKSASALGTGLDPLQLSPDNIVRNQPRRVLPTLKIISEGSSELPVATNSLGLDIRQSDPQQHIGNLSVRHPIQSRSPEINTFSVRCSASPKRRSISPKRRSISPRRARERSNSRERDIGRRRRLSISRSPSGDRSRLRRRSRSRSSHRYRDPRRRSGSRGRDRIDRKYSRTGRRSSSRDSLKVRRRRRSSSRNMSGGRASRRTDISQKRVSKEMYVDITDQDELANKERCRKDSTKEPTKTQEELVVEVAMNAYMKAVEYCDGGSEWCKSCGCILTDIVSLCRHLHSDAHQRKLNPDFDKPRPTVNHPVSINSNVAPARGYEFLMPMSAFFCSVCCEFVKNESEAEQHIKGTSHNNRFKEFLKMNPSYEAEYLKGKMAAIQQQSMITENGNFEVTKDSVKTVIKEPAKPSTKAKFQLKITTGMKSKLNKVLPGIDALGTDSESDEDDKLPQVGATQVKSPTVSTSPPVVIRKFGIKGSTGTTPGQKNDVVPNSIKSKSTLGWQLAAVVAQKKNSTTIGTVSDSTVNGSTVSSTAARTVTSDTFSLDMFDSSSAPVSQLRPVPPRTSVIKTTVVNMSDFAAVDEC